VRPGLRVRGGKRKIFQPMTGKEGNDDDPMRKGRKKA